MFKNDVEEEADFCESYKSQILNVDSDEEPSPFGFVIKILTVLVLLAILVAVSIYSYNYFINENRSSDILVPPVSIQTIDDDELKVTFEKPLEEPNKKSEQLDKKKVDTVTIDKIANDVKIAIAEKESQELNKSIDKEVKKEKETLKVPTGDSKSAYIEELAKLTEELDKDRE